MTRNLGQAAVGATLLILILAIPVMATPVAGTSNITGDVTIGLTSINFFCNPALTPSCPASYGNFASTATQTLSFVPYANQDGFIHNLSSSAQPVNQTFSLPNFLFFTPSASLPTPDIALDLSFIFTGVFGQAQCAAAPAPGQTCTPAIAALVTPANPLGLSPFNFVNTQTGSTASFSVQGSARRISTGELSPFTGEFTFQFDGQTYQQVLAAVFSGGTVTSSYSANFNATASAVPEPTALGLVAVGLVGIGIKRRLRRIRRHQ